MSNAGFEVSTATVDISSRDSIHNVVEAATKLGETTGIIITPLAKDELTGPRAEGYRRMIEACPVRARRDPGRSRKPWSAPHGARRCVHYGQ